MTDRNDRQVKVINWAKEAFGEEEATSLSQRGLRLLEEAAEAFQACGRTEDMAHKMIEYVFSRPIGEIGQELGGVGVCVLALAAAAKLSADAEEEKETNRVISKPLQHFRERNTAKNEA